MNTRAITENHRPAGHKRLNWVDRMLLVRPKGSRNQAASLARLNDHMLADIGLTRSQIGRAGDFDPMTGELRRVR